MLTVKYWDERLYPKKEDKSPVVGFVSKMGSRIKANDTVLDIGAGAGLRSVYDYKNQCREMIGIDVDPRVEENPLLHRGICCDANTMPLEDNSVDLAFTVYVLEHVEDPGRFCAEIARVLKPGGEFWSLTPNRLHYVPLIASLTPTRFHQWVNEKRGRKSDDTFPTYYRLNSKTALNRHFNAAGMEAIEVATVEGRPNYLRMAAPLFLLGAAYERIVNSTRLLEGFRVNYVLGFKKNDV